MTLCTRAAAALCVLLSPAVCLAQSPGPAWFAGGFAGVTFTGHTSGAFGAQVGRRVAPRLYLTGEVGRLDDVMPREIADQIDDLIDEFVPGLDLNLGIAVRGTYGLIGGRWRPSSRRVSPFAEGGVGPARVSVHVGRAELGGVDVRAFVREALPDTTSVVDLLIAAGGGAAIRVSPRATVDAGYRFMQIATGRPNVNVHMVYGALRWVSD